MSEKQTILVVDHQRTIRNILARELKPSYDVLFAEDGVQAIRIYELHAHEIASLVIDVRLPRLNGRAVTEWVHHIFPNLPVIIMSRALDDDVQEMLASPAVTFLRKPFRLSELKKVLRELVSSQSLAATAS